MADVADADPAWPAGPPGDKPEPLQLVSTSSTTPTKTLAALALNRLTAPARSRPDKSVRACSQPNLRPNRAVTHCPKNSKTRSPCGTCRVPTWMLEGADGTHSANLPPRTPLPPHASSE